MKHDLDSRPDAAVLRALFSYGTPKLTLPDVLTAEIDLAPALTTEEHAYGLLQLMQDTVEAAKDKQPNELTAAEQFAVLWLAGVPIQQWSDDTSGNYTLHFRVDPAAQALCRIVKNNGVFGVERVG